MKYVYIISYHLISLSCCSKDALVYYVILVLIPVIIPVTWLRQIKYFAVTNTIASGLVMLSILFMLVILTMRLAHAGPAPHLTMCDWHETLIYTGTALYAFEGVAVVLPIEERSLKRRIKLRSLRLSMWHSLLICG